LGEREAEQGEGRVLRVRGASRETELVASQMCVHAPFRLLPPPPNPTSISLQAKMVGSITDFFDLDDRLLILPGFGTKKVSFAPAPLDSSTHTNHQPGEVPHI
jgi:hypothetical protein